MTQDMTGRVALVTGAASGIGAASAEAFAEVGASVVLVDIDATTLEATAERVRGRGWAGTISTSVTDLADPDAIAALFDRVLADHGRLDHAHNNAGISQPRLELADTPEEVFDRVIRVNLKSIWLCMQHEIRIMLDQGKGSIVNTSSSAGLVGAPTIAAYSASKHGIIGLTKTAALEYSGRGIRVNAVCPSVIRTGLFEDSIRDRPELLAQYEALHPIGRLGLPSEVGEAVRWLCTDEAGFITGHALPIDGGRLSA